MMNIRERAAYAWSRIVELFSPRKPEIEVEVEEITDDFSFAEPDEEKVEQDYSPDDLDEDMTEETAEGETKPEAESADPFRMDETAENPEKIPNRMEEEEIPSRMTGEYKAWLAEQREAADADSSTD